MNCRTTKPVVSRGKRCDGVILIITIFTMKTNVTRIPGLSYQRLVFHTWIYLAIAPMVFAHDKLVRSAKSGNLLPRIVHREGLWHW